jgi:hypothetical protein
MKNYSRSRSTSIRALLAFVLFTADGSLALKAASLDPEAINTASQRTLTFADRVAHQRAVEEVYWRHRIWPKENPGPKPSLDEVMSQQQIQQKVQEYLSNSQLLAFQWHRPITSEQLQGEINRMASHTRQPEVLRELFAALDDDPFIIAECLARPTLSERLLSDLWLGSNPVAETQSVGSSVVRMEKESSVAIDQPASGYYLPQIANSQVEDPAAGSVDHWTATSLTGAPDARAYHTAIWTGTEMIVWGGGVSGLAFKSGGRYNPMTDSWVATRIPSMPLVRSNHTAVWTGTEMMVWGGTDNQSRYFKDGARYNPSTETWVALPKTPNTLIGRILHTAVWTGTEMIFWGGYNGSGVNTGGRYNPSTNSWVVTTTTGAPDARSDHTAVWTGSEMIVWGGSGALNTGGRYNPITDNWIATTTTGAPHGRAQHTAVWTGTEMIVWGGSFLNTGGRYNPITDNWVATTTIDAPAGRQSHIAVWTGSEMIVWGGQRPGFLNTGGRYSP